jgi:zinc transport system ATP-binding protein
MQIGGVSIEIEGVSFSYHGEKVLEDVGFSVARGDYLGIIGPNGGGKTTLIRIILGLLKPDTGSVRIFGGGAPHGVNVGATHRVNGGARASIGYVAQHAVQGETYFPASVEEVVKSGRFARMGFLKRFSDADRAAVEKAMETADVGRLGRRLIGSLSVGQLQRVLIARALASEPEILILDEPVTGVDIASQTRFYAFLELLNKELGITILFVTHDVGVIAREATSVMCLNRKLFCHGSPEDFISGEFLETLYGHKVNPFLHRH